MNLNSWANLAAILLILEAFILVLPALIISFLAVRGLRALDGKLANEWFPLVRTQVTRVETTTKRVSASLVEPPIRVMSAAHGVRVGARAIFGERQGPASM